MITLRVVSFLADIQQTYTVCRLYMRSKIIAIRLTDEMVDKIDDVSNGLFISRSDFIRMAVAKQLNKHFQKQKDQDLDWEQLFSDKI